MICFAHRGASGYYPENTMLAFKKAIQMRADGIELDVQKCKSGELVVIHDFKIDRTTNGFGYVKDFTLNELRKLDAGNGEKIPLLSEILEIIPQKTLINIELKGKNTAELVSDMINDFITQNKIDKKQIIVSSFNTKEIKKFYEINKDIKLGVIISGLPIGAIHFAKKLTAYAINPSLEFVTKSFVKKAHKNNFKVCVWTVNDEKSFERMNKIGVDCVFSNYPDIILG